MTLKILFRHPNSVSTRRGLFRRVDVPIIVVSMYVQVTCLSINVQSHDRNALVTKTKAFLSHKFAHLQGRNSPKLTAAANR
jgi:hypothetical protein